MRGGRANRDECTARLDSEYKLYDGEAGSAASAARLPAGAGAVGGSRHEVYRGERRRGEE